jgi:hypothetical protein
MLAGGAELELGRQVEGSRPSATRPPHRPRLGARLAATATAATGSAEPEQPPRTPPRRHEVRGPSALAGLVPPHGQEPRSPTRPATAATADGREPTTAGRATPTRAADGADAIPLDETGGLLTRRLAGRTPAGSQSEEDRGAWPLRGAPHRPRLAPRWGDRPGRSDRAWAAGKHGQGRGLHWGPWLGSPALRLGDRVGRRLHLPHGAANLAGRAVKGSHWRRPQGPSLRRRRHDPHHRSKGRGVLPEPSQQSSLASPSPSKGGGATASRATSGVGRP